MELPLPARFILRHFSHPLVAKAARAIGFAKLANATDTKLYATSPAMGLVSIREESPAAYLAAGRLLERVWLAATGENLAFHPVTGILFLARSVAHDAAERLLPEHLPVIRAADAKIRRAFALPEGAVCAMLFRVGFAPAASARSARRAPDIRTS